LQQKESIAARATTFSSDAMERKPPPTRAVQDGAYLCWDASSRNAASATEGARRLVPRGMSAGFSPGSTALHAVKLGPTESRLAFGELRLNPFWPCAGKMRRIWLRGSTPVVVFNPTQLVYNHIERAY